MDSGKAELLAGIAGAGAFLTTLVVLGWPLWLCLTLTALIYLGLNMLLGGVVQNKVQQIMGVGAATLDQLSRQIDLHRQELKELRRWASSVPTPGIRLRVTNVCDLSEKIFRNFEEDPEDIRRAHRFLSQFKKVLPIVRDYVHLASDKDRRKVLTDEDEQNVAQTLEIFETNLQEAYRGFQENNVQKLRLATGTLKRMLEMDRSIHRSDRKSS
ncbi:5-bromo-4-chloroindolyl phosphate hydrolysis family protein [uncultured Desulfosarcina sp.]|uniref:5-bromo-4-chloroindolyl phosphate hydrolysis family protein n=1 Tax=uncultured Desulfosarcina sp. TaxID=218289 RepID=UPI0029C7DD23|nr:5-bromo-4-chloroindolyl phosphate hydrolysis family protein [uncultured Desulfosarcina sp.]